MCKFWQVVNKMHFNSVASVCMVTAIFILIVTAYGAAGEPLNNKLTSGTEDIYVNDDGGRIGRNANDKSLSSVAGLLASLLGQMKTPKRINDESKETCTHKLSPANCGTAYVSAETGKIEPSKTIVNGNTVAKNAIPWQVSLQYNSNGQHFCGGCVMSSTTIVTAAHCVCTNNRTTKASKIRIKAGTNEWKGTDGQVRRVASIKTHPQYNDNTCENDIAILILVEPLEFGNSVNAICMPCPGDTRIRPYNSSISGWGMTNDAHKNGRVPDQMQIANVTVEADQVCHNSLSPIATYNRSSMMCQAKSKMGACYGDSGGCMYCMDNGRAYLEGINSWAVGECANANYPPTVWTNFRYFVKWIEEICAS